MPYLTLLHELVALAQEVETDNPLIEDAKIQNPDEFALGAAVMAYRIRRSRV